MRVINRRAPSHITFCYLILWDIKEPLEVMSHGSDPVPRLDHLCHGLGGWDEIQPCFQGLFLSRSLEPGDGRKRDPGSKGGCDHV